MGIWLVAVEQPLVTEVIDDVVGYIVDVASRKPSESVHEMYWTGNTTISCPAILSSGRSATGGLVSDGLDVHATESAATPTTKESLTQRLGRKGARSCMVAVKVNRYSISSHTLNH